MAAAMRMSMPSTSHRPIVRFAFALLTGVACAGSGKVTPPVGGGSGGAAGSGAGDAGASGTGGAGTGAGGTTDASADSALSPTGAGGAIGGNVDGGISSLPSAAIPNRATMYSGTF